MSRRFSNRVKGLADEKRVKRLLARADAVGRRSARQHGIVLGTEGIAALRTAIAKDQGNDKIKLIGRLSASTLIFQIDFHERVLAAIYDERSRSICSFQRMDAPLVKNSSRLMDDDQLSVLMNSRYIANN